MFEGTENYLRGIVTAHRLKGIRETARVEKSFCFFESFYEVTTRINPKLIPPTMSRIRRECLRSGWGDSPRGGGVSKDHLFDALSWLCQTSRMSVSRIVCNPSYFERISENSPIPAEFKDKVISWQEPTYHPTYPHVRILGFYFDETDFWKMHAQADFDPQGSNIKDLVGKGWKTAAVIEFNKQEN